jgi:hypothetical protein
MSAAELALSGRNYMEGHMKKLAIWLTISITLIANTVVETAKASSIYDSAVQLTSTLEVAANSSSTPIDITNSWYSHIVSASGSCSDSIKTSLQKALDHGSLAVNQEINNSSSTDYRRVQVSWSESATVPEMIWSGAGSNASVTFPSIYPGPPSTGGAILYMNSSGNVQVFCDVAAFGQTWSNATGTALGFFATNPPDYPSGYSGSSIPTYFQGGIISGNVQCANTSNVISNVLIDTQSSVDGNALLTDDGTGGKNYRFYLWDESPYSLTVMCDGDAFYSPIVDTNLYYYYHWACVPTTPGQNPNFRICAAS